MEQGGSLVHADGGDTSLEWASGGGEDLVDSLAEGGQLDGRGMLLHLWGIKLRRRGEEREGEAGEVERREEAVGSNCWTKFHAAF